MTDPMFEPLPPRAALSDAEAVERAEAAYGHFRLRRTVRDFADTPVPRALVEAALRAAGTAPSGANMQPWHFAVIESAAARSRLRSEAEAEERDFYAERAPAEWLSALAPFGTDASKPFLEIAPVIIAIFAQRTGPDTGKGGARSKHYYVSESVGIATGLLIATLHAAGLATLTHTPSPMGFLNDICGRPANEKPFMLLVAGHPAAGCTVPVAGGVKKPLSAIANWV